MKKEGFSFQEKLAEGLKAEQKFLSLWGALLQLTASPTEELRWDMSHISGQRAELKTESRALVDTPNFFIERYSSIESNSPGGPWQSYPKGVTLLYYWFPKDSQVFLFDSLPLLMGNIEQRKLTMKQVPNKAENGREAFTGGGYAVKRTTLAFLYIHYKGDRDGTEGSSL